MQNGRQIIGDRFSFLRRSASSLRRARFFSLVEDPPLAELFPFLKVRVEAHCFHWSPATFTGQTQGPNWGQHWRYCPLPN